MLVGRYFLLVCFIILRDSGGEVGYFVFFIYMFFLVFFFDMVSWIWEGKVEGGRFGYDLF